MKPIEQTVYFLKEDVNLEENYYIQDLNGNSQIELGEFNSYEEAELACLKKLIEIVKNK